MRPTVRFCVCDCHYIMFDYATLTKCVESVSCVHSVSVRLRVFAHVSVIVKCLTVCVFVYLRFCVFVCLCVCVFVCLCESMSVYVCM